MIFEKDKVDKKILKILKTLDGCNQFEIESILDDVKKHLIYFPLRTKP